MSKAPVVSWVWLAMVTGLASCRSSDADGNRGFDLQPVETYAYDWVGSVPEAEVLDRVQRALDAHLAPRGLVRVRTSEAQVFVVPQTHVEVTTAALDPNFTFHVAEKRERGTLELQFRDAASGTVLAAGRAMRPLRTLARGNGVTVLVFVETGEERQWPVEEMVQEILQVTGWLDREVRDPNSPLGRDARRDLQRRIEEVSPSPVTVPTWTPGAASQPSR